uniref:Radial spoke head protein 9 homolog n=1 Tax=Astyanax mexicanus TaxID=7994 RepID=A0A3B1JKJ9_ASTMX
MDLEALYTSLDLLSRFGVTLNAEHRAALQTSFIILKTHMKFSRVLFWGKIFGLERDYYIAQGLGEDEIKDRKYFYSQDCIDWYLLPPATETLIDEVAVAAKGRFMGDPSHKYEQGTMEKEEGADTERLISFFWGGPNPRCFLTYWVGHVPPIPPVSTPNVRQLPLH